MFSIVLTFQVTIISFSLEVNHPKELKGAKRGPGEIVTLLNPFKISSGKHLKNESQWVYNVNGQCGGV
jgi:hypothetical protein